MVHVDQLLGNTHQVVLPVGEEGGTDQAAALSMALRLTPPVLQFQVVSCLDSE
jgi:hypothetical protein